MKLKVTYLNKITTIWFHVALLNLAIEKGNTEIAKILLANEKLNINIVNILLCILYEI